jgi:hypothetical protein
MNLNFRKYLEYHLAAVQRQSYPPAKHMKTSTGKRQCHKAFFITGLTGLPLFNKETVSSQAFLSEAAVS